MIPMSDGSSAAEGWAMMGRQRRDQGSLFYEFRLEDRIPENHLLRRMNVFVTAEVARAVCSCQFETGRLRSNPSIVVTSTSGFAGLATSSASLHAPSSLP